MGFWNAIEGGGKDLVGQESDIFRDYNLGSAGAGWKFKNVWDRHKEGYGQNERNLRPLMHSLGIRGWVGDHPQETGAGLLAALWGGWAAAGGAGGAAGGSAAGGAGGASTGGAGGAAAGGGAAGSPWMKLAGAGIGGGGGGQQPQKFEPVKFGDIYDNNSWLQNERSRKMMADELRGGYGNY